MIRARPVSRWIGALVLAALAGGCRVHHEVCYGIPLDTVTFVPPAGPLPRNGRILVFESTARHHVDHLGDGSLVFEPAGSKTAAAAEAWRSSHHCDAEVLTPPGAGTFALAPASANPEDPLVRMALAQRRWTVSSVPDTQPPRWLAPPTVRVPRPCSDLGYSLELCDDEFRLVVTAPAVDDGPALYFHVKATGSDGSLVEAPIIPSGNPPTFKLGSDCQGDFHFARGVHYKLWLTAIDVAGHEVSAPGSPVTFDGYQPLPGTG